LGAFRLWLPIPPAPGGDVAKFTGQSSLTIYPLPNGQLMAIPGSSTPKINHKPAENAFQP